MSNRPSPPINGWLAGERPTLIVLSGLMGVRRRRDIDVEPLDFACDRPVQMRLVDEEGGFADYTVVDHRRMVERFFKRYPLNPTHYEARVDRIARYPDSFVCR